MRILLKKSSKEKLFNYLIEKNNCNSLKEFSNKLNIPYKTVQSWRYEPNRYIPEKIIPHDLYGNLEILDRQEDNWGKIKGGKETYKIILNKYGKKELDRRRENANKKPKSYHPRKDSFISIDISDPNFLEFYGSLLGDGWLSKLKYKEKKLYIVGISGNRKLDLDYFLYLRKIIYGLINRTVYIKDRPKAGSIEIYFNHKSLVNFLSKELNFPIGPKIDLEINPKIYDTGFSHMKYVIRGILDTDGCFYFDKTPKGDPYPCIGICMKAPKLIKQVYDLLIEQGYKVQHNKSRSPSEQLILKGRKQINKWMKEIGSSNKRNLDKFARVVQFG